MDDALRQLIETPAYLAGQDAFDGSLVCPHPEGSPEAHEWWSGWQQRAGEYLSLELAKAFKP